MKINWLKYLKEKTDWQKGYEKGKKDQFEKDRDEIISDLYSVGYQIEIDFYGNEVPDINKLDDLIDKWEQKEFDDD